MTTTNTYTFYPVNPAIGNGYTIRTRNSVVSVDPKNREIHTWNRHACNTWALAEDEDCKDAFTKENSIRDGRKFLTSTKKLCCPNELKNNGVCPKRFHPDHKGCFYHFAALRATSRSIVRHEGKPVCRYSLTDEDNMCWEAMNSEHNKVFLHKD